MRQHPFCRIIIDPQPSHSSWNMAVDEALLEAAIDRRQCTLRWYQWSEATISLGYFQDADSAAAFPEFSSLPIVRRLSGGGAILHHHELTYSCAVPATHALARSPHELYERVHIRIMAVLARHGIAARMRGDGSGFRNEQFFCFDRRDPRDVVYRSRKILGSAQRRRRGSILQHGSLLLRRSQYAPRFPGILDLAASVILDRHFTEELSSDLCALFGKEATYTTLPEPERRRALELEQRTRIIRQFAGGVA